MLSLADKTSSTYFERPERASERSALTEVSHPICTSRATGAVHGQPLKDERKNYKLTKNVSLDNVHES